MTDEIPSTRLGDLLGAKTVQSLTQTVADVAMKTGSLASAGPLLKGAVEQAVGAALDMDVLAFLADAWTTAREIHALKKPDRPDAVSIVKLGKHSITRELKPVVHVRIGAETDVPLDIALALIGAFEGIELSVGGGAILAVGSGACNLSLEFRLAEETVGEPVKLGAWKLPGEHRFTPPVAIP